MFLHYWFLLPVGIVVAFIAMSAGVSGAALWIPVYMMWLGLEASVAFWLGLFTMLFGFGSGSYRNWRDGAYNTRLVARYGAASVPAAVAGGLAAASVPTAVLISAFGLFLLGYGLWLGIGSGRIRAPDGRGESIAYGAAMVEGVLTGLISVGTGVFTVPSILRDRSVRGPGEAVGSGVMLIFITSIAATAGRLRPPFIKTLEIQRYQLLGILIWAVPAVIIGGQLGPRAAQAMTSRRNANLYLSATLVAIAILTLIRARALAPGGFNSLVFWR